MSSSIAHGRAAKKRNYRLGKRGAMQQETRQRIVDAAVELHCTLGPARTTVAQIAEKAGVQRHTYYAHFPDERSLFLACSATASERDPLPDFKRLESEAAGGPRIRRGLAELYAWYARNADQAACVLRDAEHHELTREMVELRMAPVFREAAEVLGEQLDSRGRALLEVALGFACWRTLSNAHAADAAADLMSEAIERLSR